MKTRATKNQAQQAQALTIRAKGSESRTAKHALRGTAVTALVLATLTLLAPIRSQATVVVATRVGNVAVRVSDAPRPSARLLVGRPNRPDRAILPLANGRPGIVRCSCIDGRPQARGGSRGHHGHGRKIWIPGHWEKTFKPQARGRLVVRTIRRIWIPGHWCRI